jgi:hypothetical protein
MNTPLSLRTVLRRTFRIYAEQAPLLLAVALVLDGVVVLDRVRPGRLRALGRSRQLVSGNAWRVLALILMLAIPLALAAAEVERAARTAGSTPATAVIQLLVATLIAPIPALATIALYLELHRTELTPRLRARGSN